MIKIELLYIIENNNLHFMENNNLHFIYDTEGEEFTSGKATTRYDVYYILDRIKEQIDSLNYQDVSEHTILEDYANTLIKVLEKMGV